MTILWLFPDAHPYITLRYGMIVSVRMGDNIVRLGAGGKHSRHLSLPSDAERVFALRLCTRTGEQARDGKSTQLMASPGNRREAKGHVTAQLRAGRDRPRRLRFADESQLCPERACAGGRHSWSECAARWLAGT
jgi:hypothetical protein